MHLLRGKGVEMDKTRLICSKCGEEFDDLINVSMHQCKSQALAPKTQIIYVPPHLREEIPAEPFPYGMESGFITSGPTEDGSYFCMYWQLTIDGYITSDLRTKSNSELTPVDCILVKD